MRKAFVVVVGLLFAGVFANQALAATVDPGGGYIEICKAANPALTGQFQFTIHDASGAPDQIATIAIGTCSQPIAVLPGSVTVTENGSLTGLTNQGTVSSTPDTSFLSATTTAVGPLGPLPSGTGFTYTATVPASPGGSQNVVTVTFNDQLVTGVVEVCKQIVTGSGLTGTFSFTITGANGFTQVVTVPIGACSSPVTVPAGKVKVQETGDLAESVTAITATQTASNADAVLGPNASAPKYDLATATVVAAVAAGDASKQTIVTMTNTSVRLKLCKYVGEGLTNLGPYSFALTSTGNPGPTAVPATVSLAAGTSFAGAVCTVIGTFRAGTMVTITEGIVPGTKVGSIVTSPTTNVGGGSTVVPGSLSLPNRTVAVILGAGETVVTYEDIPALNGTLKLCKAATTTPPLIPTGTPFSFTVAPVAPTTGATTTVTVPSGSCIVVGSFAFDSTWAITEAAAPNITVVSITAVPTNVVVLDGGAPTNTNQLVLTNTNLGTRSTNVTIGEDNITDVTFTNQDPPEGSSPGGGSSSGGGVGGSTSGGGATSGGSAGSTGGVSAGGGGDSTTTGGGGGSILTSEPSIAASFTPPMVVGNGITVGTSTGSSRAGAVTQLKHAVSLATLRKELATNKATLKKLLKQKAAAKTLVRKNLLGEQIAVLQAKDLKLAKAIKKLA